MKKAILALVAVTLLSAGANSYLINNIDPQSATAQVVSSSLSTLPELPRFSVNTAYPPITGTSHKVLNGQNLQAVIDAALPGDEIVLADGATFTGNFTLPNKSGNGTVVIRAETIPVPPGTRMNPTRAQNVAKLVSTNTLATVQAQLGAHNYRLVGFEVTRNYPGTAQNNGIVRLGDGLENSVSEFSYDIVLDRMYIHETPTGNTSRCVSLNGKNQAVIDSYLSECHGKGFDSQAIAGFFGPGPYLIQNNYLEGAGENIIFGGSDPRIPGIVPSDITIVRNHLYKPLSWGNGKWTVKNLFEIKNGQRVLLEGNVLENNWVDGQTGMAILLKAVSQSGSAPWSTAQDITIRNNIIKNSTSGVNLLYRASSVPTVGLSRVLFSNNLFEQVGGDPIKGGGSGMAIQMLQDVRDVRFDHNTFTFNSQANLAIAMDTPPSIRTTITNNIFQATTYGVKGTGTAVGNYTIAAFAPDAYIAGNIFTKQNSIAYPAGNFFPALFADIMFININSSDFGLSSGSIYKNKGTDGKDPGVDWAVLQAAVAGVTTGSPTTSTPTVLSPTVSFSASPTSIVLGSSAILSWSSTNATSCNASSNWEGGNATSGSQTVTPTSTKTYTITCGGVAKSVVVNVTPKVTEILTPTVSLSSSSSSILSGSSATITWSSTNATSCIASGGWTGTKATSGTQSVTPTANTTYTLSCTGAGGTDTKSVTVNVTTTVVTPTVALSSSASSIVSGSSATLTWSSTNATSCTASGGWTGTKATSGTQSVSPTANTTYTMTCGGVSKSVVVNVTAKVTETPTTTVSFSASPTTIVSGSSATLFWSSTNATSCTASSNWEGAKATSGSQIVTPTSTKTYTITCGGVSKSVVVNVTAKVTETPTNTEPKQETPVVTEPKTETPTTTYTLTKTLYFGMRDPQVTTLQTILIKLGYSIDGNPTGYFGKSTETAVKAFQKAKGIVSSGNRWSTGYGVVGPKTRTMLLSAVVGR